MASHHKRAQVNMFGSGQTRIMSAQKLSTQQMQKVGKETENKQDTKSGTLF